jgi:hypothetical protein
MTIEDWLSEKKGLCGGRMDNLSRGSRIIDAWWNLSSDDPGLHERMRDAANEILTGTPTRTPNHDHETDHNRGS